MRDSYLNDEALAELAEYDRIVRFAEQVISGTHPRVKIPLHLAKNVKQRTNVGVSHDVKNEFSGTLRPYKSASNEQKAMQSSLQSQWDRSYSIEPPPHGAYNAPVPIFNGFLQQPPAGSMSDAFIISSLAAITLNRGPQGLDQQETDSPPTLSSVSIDFQYNYYKDLGVQPGVGLSSITRGYQSKVELWSPKTTSGKRRWFSTEQWVRSQAKSMWDKVQKAFKILSDPGLRGEYERGYCGPPIMGAGKAGDGDKSTADNRKGHIERKDRVREAKRRRTDTAVKMEHSRPRRAARLEKRGSASSRAARTATVKRERSPPIVRASPQGPSSRVAGAHGTGAASAQKIKIEPTDRTTSLAGIRCLKDDTLSKLQDKSIPQGPKNQSKRRGGNQHGKRR